MARSRKSKTEPPTQPEEVVAGAEVGPSEGLDAVEDHADTDDTPNVSETSEPDLAAEDAGRAPTETEEAVTLPPDLSDDEGKTQTPPLEPEPQPADPAPRRGGFLAPALGGVVAAGLGFGLAVYVMPKVWTPESTAEEIAALSAALKTQDGRIGTLTSDIAALTAAPSAAAAEDVAALETRLTDALTKLGASVSSSDEKLTLMATQLEALDTRLAELEKRPVEGGAASATALDAFGREMEALRAEIAAQREAAAAAQEQIAAMTDEAAAQLESAQRDAESQRELAEEAARQSAIRAGIGRLQAALESGASIEEGLADLVAAGVDVPPALTEQAHGVPSLASLREAFPPAARDAIAASLKEQSNGGMWDRITAFARSQSGARSLTPRAGDDPDAILSRAEAALGAGDLATAIEEVGTLPADGQARMAEWIVLAERRRAAVDAVAALAAEHR